MEVPTKKLQSPTRTNSVVQSEHTKRRRISYNIAHEKKRTENQTKFIQVNNKNQSRKSRYLSLQVLTSVAQAPQLCKMSFQVQKSKCVIWYQASESATTMLMRFRMEFCRESPTKMSNCKWYKGWWLYL